MRYDITLTLLLNNDLMDIRNNLSEYGENMENIFVESFYKFIDDVSYMPFMYPQYIPKPKYRKAPLAYDYVVFYKTDKKNKTVIISRILHGKQNIGKIL